LPSDVEHTQSNESIDKWESDRGDLYKSIMAWRARVRNEADKSLSDTLTIDSADNLSHLGGPAQGSSMVKPNTDPTITVSGLDRMYSTL
jgi:hypothetical protein